MSASSHVPAGGQLYSELGDLETMRHAVNYNRSLLDLVARFGASPMLDFGAGLGTHAQNARGRGWEITCVEPDPVFGQTLIQRGFPTVASIDAVPAESFPFAYTFNVIEHIEDDIAALRGLLRALLPGGRLLVYVPAFEVLYGPMDKAVGHHRRYTRAGLAAKLTEVGFRVEESGYADSLGFLAAYLYRFMGDKDGRVSPGSVKIYDRFIFPVSRAFDVVVSSYFGKNLYMTAIKPTPLRPQ